MATVKILLSDRSQLSGFLPLAQINIPETSSFHSSSNFILRLNISSDMRRLKNGLTKIEFRLVRCCHSQLS